MVCSAALPCVVASSSSPKPQDSTEQIMQTQMPGWPCHVAVPSVYLYSLRRTYKREKGKNTVRNQSAESCAREKQSNCHMQHDDPRRKP